MILLQGYCKVFNDRYPRLRYEPPEYQEGNRSFLADVLLQIETSLRSFKKWFTKLYEQQIRAPLRGESLSIYSQFMEEVESDERVMSNEYLPEPVRLLGITVVTQRVSSVSLWPDCTVSSSANPSRSRSSSHARR